MLSEFVGHGWQQSVAGVHDSRPDVVEHERTGAVSALGLDVNKANTWRCRTQLLRQNSRNLSEWRPFNKNLNSIKITHSSGQGFLLIIAILAIFLFQLYDKYFKGFIGPDLKQFRGVSCLSKQSREWFKISFRKLSSPIYLESKIKIIWRLHLTRPETILTDEGCLLVADAARDGNALQGGQLQVAVHLGRRTNPMEHHKKDSKTQLSSYHHPRPHGGSGLKVFFNFVNGEQQF